MSNRVAHLQFLQDVIARMSNHSFLLKGWMITVVAGLVALSVTSKQPSINVISLSAIVFFWLLDAYFLWRERHFRALYNVVRTLSEAEIDFNMDPNSIAEGKKESYFDLLRTPTLSLFYVGAAFVPALVMWGDVYG